MLDPDEFSSSKTTLTYPSLHVNELFDTLPLITELLEEGSMPLTVVYEGRLMVIKRISASAYNIDKLLRCCGSLVYNKSSSEGVDIQSVLDYMEVFV